jgi:hypothetical protein
MPTAIELYIDSLGDLERLKKRSGYILTRSPDNPDVVFLSVDAKDGEHYRVQFLCDNYPTTAPSAVFVNQHGSKDDPKAWPHGNSRFLEVVKPPPNCFLCTDLTREGLKHHPDWMNGATAWNITKHTLMTLINYIAHNLLNSDDYIGRNG